MKPTFKDFMAEEERKIYAKKFTNLPEFTPGKAESNYRIGKANFSARDGLGSTPFGSDPYYFGFVGLLKPSTFLKLVLPHDDRHEDAANIRKLHNEGYALGVPFLNIKVDDGVPRITGHEGRARMLAIQKINGDDPVAVHFILGAGLRARDLTPEIIAKVKDGIQIEQSKEVIKSPLTKMFVDYKEV